MQEVFKSINKAKMYEILITACISAGIAFLQTLLSHYTATPLADTNIVQAGLVGGIIQGARNLRYG